MRVYNKKLYDSSWQANRSRRYCTARLLGLGASQYTTHVVSACLPGGISAAEGDGSGLPGVLGKRGEELSWFGFHIFVALVPHSFAVFTVILLVLSVCARRCSRQCAHILHNS